MKVALIGPGTLPIPPDGWGGTERVIWNLYRQAERAGFQAEVVNASGRRALTAECRRMRPDVIHLHAPWRATELLAYLLEQPTPLVTTCHDPEMGEGIPAKVVASLDLADVVIALSHAIGTQLQAARYAEVRVIPNGVDTTLFHPRHKRPRTVLAVGRNTARKRFAEIANFFLARPDYQLTLCGPGMRESSGRRRPAIPHGANIRLLENQSEDAVAALMGESDYFVHLADAEASSLVVREAMASGCRVWTTAAIAAGLTNVALTWDEATGDQSLGTRAAREAVNDLDWSVTAAQHAEVYRAVIARWTASSSVPAAMDRYRDLARRQATIGARARALRQRMKRWRPLRRLTLALHQRLNLPRRSGPQP